MDCNFDIRLLESLVVYPHLQAHALIELQAWLKQHNKEQQLYQQYIRDCCAEDARSGYRSTRQQLLSRKEWRNMTARRRHMSITVTAPLGQL